MIRAAENKLIVEEMKRVKTSGGLIIPDGAIEPQAYGKIISIGPGVPTWDDDTNNLHIGDVIVYHKMGGQAISMKNKILCCVPFPEMYGVLEDEDVLSELEVIEIGNSAPAVGTVGANQKSRIITM